MATWLDSDHMLLLHNVQEALVVHRIAIHSSMYSRVPCGQGKRAGMHPPKTARVSCNSIDVNGIIPYLHQ